MVRPGLGDQRLGAADLELHLSEGLHHRGVVGVPLDPGVGVGPALRGHELPRLGQRGAGDAGVDRRVQHLGERAVRLRAGLEGQVVRRDPRRVDVDVDELHAAAGRGALAHPVPIVDDGDDGDAGCGALDPRDVHRPVGAEVGEHRDPVGEQRARAVALLAVQHPVLAVARQGGAEVTYVFAADLRLGIAEALAPAHLAEQESLLVGRSLVAQRVDIDEVAVRDLRDVGITRGEQPKHLGDRDGREVGTAVPLGQGDAQQAGGRESLHLGAGEHTLCVAARGSLGQLEPQLVGDPDRLGSREHRHGIPRGWPCRCLDVVGEHG